MDLHAKGASSKEAPITLFEIGAPVTTTEDNFRNLIRNLPKYIHNGKEINIIDYKKIGEIKNQGQVKKYLRKNLNPSRSIIWNTWVNNRSVNADLTQSEIYINVISFKDFFISVDANSGETSKDNIINTLANDYIDIGDEVYEIKFTYHLMTYRYYIFANPQSNKVVTEGNIFAIPIPLIHIDYIDNQK